MLHCFHDKAGAHIIEIRLDQLLIERIVAWHVGDDCFQQVIEFPAEAMHFEHARKLLLDRLKLTRPGRCVDWS